MAKLSKCPTCGANGCLVLQSRKVRDSIRRRRRCTFCASSFSTVEIRIPETRLAEAGKDYAQFYDLLDHAVESFKALDTEETKGELVAAE